jgi:hypothetical protein
VPKLKNTTDGREWGVRSAPENYEKRKKSVHQLRLSSRGSVIRRPSQANGGAASAAVAYLGGGGGGGGRVAPAGEAKEDDDVVRAFDA